MSMLRLLPLRAAGLFSAIWEPLLRQNASLQFYPRMEIIPRDASGQLLEAEALTATGENLSWSDICFEHADPLPWREVLIRLLPLSGPALLVPVRLDSCRVTRQGRRLSTGHIRHSLTAGR